MTTTTAMHPLRIYVDTSVFGGVHDDEFRVGSERFFESVRDGTFSILTSQPSATEIGRAPDNVQATFEKYAADAELLDSTEEADFLADASMPFTPSTSCTAIL